MSIGPQDLTAENLTDEQIRALRDGPDGLESEPLRAVCRVALQHGEATGRHPWCRICGWRKGGAVDSWDGKTCKCKLRAPEFYRCSACAGLGTVPYNIGSQPCLSCDGSGLIDQGEVATARCRIAAALNARAKES